MEQLSFLFYLNWKEQIEDLDDEEFRRFIYNLINYHLGEKPVLITKVDRILWNGVLPGLQANQRKYIKKVESCSENGKLGGAPKDNDNARKQNNPKQPKQPDKSKEGNENREMKNEKSEEENGNGKLETEKWKEKTVKSKIENEDFRTKAIDAGKMEINEFSIKEKSLEELQKEFMNILVKQDALKDQMIVASPHNKNIQRLISNEEWILLESNLNAEEFAVIKPTLEEFKSLKDYCNMVYQNINIKYDATKNEQETNDQ